MRVTDALGFTARSGYLNFNRPNSASFRMARGPWTFSRLGGMWNIEQDGPQFCKLFVTYNLRTTPRFIRFVLEPVMAAVFYFQTCRRMRSLRKYLSRP